MNTENIKQYKAEFQSLAIGYFGTAIAEDLKEFSEEDGYSDQHVNAMWVGFCFGRETSGNPQ